MISEKSLSLGPHLGEQPNAIFPATRLPINAGNGFHNRSKADCRQRYKYHRNLTPKAELIQRMHPFSHEIAREKPSMRRYMLTKLVLFTVLALAPLRGLQAANQPNVLFIAIDDLNHWVGHLGRNPQTKTPNIDRLAAMGVTFANAQCAAPVCNPSRAALLSGKRPGTTGIYDNNNLFTKALKPEESLVMQLKNAARDWQALAWRPRLERAVDCNCRGNR
jgi:hypothetical protein